MAKSGKKFGFNIEPSLCIDTIGLKIERIEKVFKNYFNMKFSFCDVEKLKAKYILEYIETNGLPTKNGLYDLINFLNKKKILKAIATSTQKQTFTVMNLMTVSGMTM